MSGKLSSDELADLAALADGTLPEGRRADLEARVAATPELRELLDRQRRALAALEVFAAEDVPASVQAAVESSVRAKRRMTVPRLALSGVAAVAVAAILAVVLTSGPGAPTIADAARLATQMPNAPAPVPAGTAGTRLDLRVDGISFPDLTRFAGWRAVGARRAHVDGRSATVVYYRKGERMLGYVIVAGGGLPRPETKATVIRSEPYQTVLLAGRRAVTWRRGGHTCVLIGPASRAELLRVASWPLSPSGR
jgi:anti-sigma factor RsiW